MKPTAQRGSAYPTAGRHGRPWYPLHGRQPLCNPLTYEREGPPGGSPCGEEVFGRQVDDALGGAVAAGDREGWGVVVRAWELGAVVIRRARSRWSKGSLSSHLIDPMTVIFLAIGARSAPMMSISGSLVWVPSGSRSSARRHRLSRMTGSTALPRHDVQLARLVSRTESVQAAMTTVQTHHLQDCTRHSTERSACRPSPNLAPTTCSRSCMAGARTVPAKRAPRLSQNVFGGGSQSSGQARASSVAHNLKGRLPHQGHNLVRETTSHC